MRGLFLFVAGILVGLAVQAAIAQNQNRGIVGLNHVGISVPNLDEAVEYYTKTMGFPEAFRNFDEQGQPTLVYVQISRNTFVELQPSNAQRPPGINHFGVHGPKVGLGDGHAHSRCETLAERSGGHLDSKAVVTLGMTGRVAPPLSEVAEVFERQWKPREVEHRVEEHRPVAVGEDEPVTIGPLRRVGVDVEVLRPERGRNVGHSHRHARVSTVGLLNGVHRQRLDRVDR